MILYYVSDWYLNSHCYEKDLDNYKDYCAIALKIQINGKESIYEIAPLFTSKKNIKKSYQYRFTDVSTKIHSITVDDPEFIEKVKEQEEAGKFLEDLFSNVFSF